MKHNKKRNVGLVYEFLARHAAEGVVEGDEKQVRQTIKLLRKHFRDGSELQKEFRLFRALIGAYVADRKTAERIIESSRLAARSYDRQKLDHEKSLLIRGINHIFNDVSFYNKRVDEYKLYATVQTLLNEWRQEVPSDVVRVAMYEADLIEHLMQPKQRNVLDEGAGIDSDDLIVNLMLKKVNSKYKGVLNAEQISLLNSYVLGLRSGDMTAVAENVEKLRVETLEALDAYIVEQKQNQILVEKLNGFRDLVAQEITEIDDKLFTRYLRIAGLKQEILGD